MFEVRLSLCSEKRSQRDFEGRKLHWKDTFYLNRVNSRLPVCRRRALAARLSKLAVEAGVRVLVLVMEVGVVVAGAVGPAVHRAVQRAGGGRVVVVWGSLRGAAGVQDLGVVSLPGLTLPQLPGLGLDPDEEDDHPITFKIQTFTKITACTLTKTWANFLKCIHFQNPLYPIQDQPGSCWGEGRVHPEQVARLLRVTWSHSNLGAI